MLSSSNHLDVTTTRPRPKPPGSRRASNPTRRDSNSNDVDAAHPSLPQSPPRASSSAFQPSSSSSPGPSSRPLTAMPARQRSAGLGLDQQLDLDLDLDLPSHLTAAIQRNATRGGDSLEAMDAALSPRDAALSPSPEAVAALWERARSPGLSHRDPIITSTMRAPDDDAAQGDRAADVDADGASSGALDKEWVGGLAREELEALLFHANSVIRDRERDLGIAAAIGQALLQKNISLRGRHEKVMNDLDSSIAYEEGDGDDEDDDTAENLSPSTNDWEDATPLASEANGYFGDTGGIASPLKPHPRPPYTPAASAKSRPPLSQVIFNQGPNTAGLIHSPSTHSLADSSVSGTSTRYRAARASTPYSMQTSETQKQLSLLSAQNENLLSQLTELQDEAEDAKREGGKKLRKLNKEIESLQLELEAATQRNTELEQESISASNDERARFSPDKAKKSWAFSQPASPSLSRRSTSLSNSNSISGGIEALLSKAGGHEFDDQQRALVVRLLDKMKELESTNKVLEGEKKERESRLGAALEKGVRISDEYDAVLHAHESSLSLRDHMSASGSNGVLGGGSGAESQQSSAANSPQRYQRRAIGNRVQVEGRKTVRRALRSHVGGLGGEEDEAMTPSSTLSSLASSSSSLSSLMVGRSKAPRRKRSALALTRPRILITPSMEDLAAKRREQAEGWEDETAAGPPAVGDHISSQASPRQSDASPMRRTRENSLDPSDANKIAWQMRRSSLDDDQSAAPHTPSRQRRVSPPSLSSPVASTSNGNEGAYDRYMAHFSTPDKTRRAQLEANAAADRSDASPWQRRPSGRYRRSSITSNLDDSAAYRQQTLGSELGSVFGDERGGDDDTLRVNETPASQRVQRPGRLLRSAASFESLGGHSEAMSDIAHLRWSKENMTGPGGPDARGSNGVNTSPLSERQRQRLHQNGGQLVVRHRDFSSTSNRSLHHASGSSSLWESSLSSTTPLISPGSLRNRAQEPGEEQYTLLGEISRDQPVQWADDDDYGVPLKESEARRLGLAPPLGQQRRALPAPEGSGGGGVRRMLRGRTSSAALGLLSWAIGGSSSSNQRSRSQTVDGSQSTATAAIQSASQLEEERQREEMLRNKYHVARQRRLDLRGRDALEEEEQYLDEEWEVQERSRALASASAYTSPSRRKAWYNRPRPGKVGKGKGSPPSAARGVRYDQPGDELDDNAPSSPTLPTSSSALALRNSTSQVEQRSSKPPTRKRDLVRNFKPSKAVDEVTAWISLVFVLILAFFVSASQGPKRILGGEERRGGTAGGEEAQMRKQRAWESEQKRRYIQYRDEVDEVDEEHERRSARSAPGAGAVRRGGGGQRGSRSQDAQSMAPL